MNRAIILTVVVLFVGTAGPTLPVLAGALFEIELDDGSRLKGEVVSMEAGAYVVKTEAMGTITIPADKIVVMRSATVRSKSPAAKGTGTLESIQKNMAADPGIMQKIMNLQNDPEMQAVLSDPEVMEAVQNFDLETLRNHPKIKALMENEKVKSIQSDIH